MSASSASAHEAGVAPVSEAGGGALGSGGGGGEGSSSSITEHGQQPVLTTLDDVMRAPSSTLPDVIVLESLPEGLDRKEVLDPKEDLWLTSADGRYSSPVVPLHVGEHPYMETFYVHRDILLKYEYFEKALCGGFLESQKQSLCFPDDDPGVFHFMIAYIYEGRYDPIKPIASVLIPDEDKGKGKDAALSPTVTSDSDDSAASFGSDQSAQSRRRRERRRRRADRNFERLRQKHPGAHRPNCGCPTCQQSSGGPPCWACAAPRAPPPPQPMHHPPGVVMLDRDGNPLRRPGPPRHDRMRPGRPGPPRRGGNHNYPLPPMPMPAPPPPPGPGGWARPLGGEGRIFGEDLRTWLLAYELNIDVYILANKFLMDGFKREVARAAIDMLETAGSDAAVPQVLKLCGKLRSGLPESDPLLKMVFARVGFLQGLLWRRDPETTERFLVENPDVAAFILRETVVRREEDYGGRNLPSMERAWSPLGYNGGNEFAGGRMTHEQRMFRAPGPYAGYPGRGGRW